MKSNAGKAVAERAGGFVCAAIAAFAALAMGAADAQELLRLPDGTAGVNALPVSENRWQTREISVPGGLKESHYKSLTNLDFFALEYGEGFPETTFDTTGTNTFRKVFGYSKKEGGAGIRFGRGWGKYVMSRYGVDVDIEQSGDTEWLLTYNKASDWVETRRFAVKGTGRVKLSQTVDMIAPIVRNTEVSGLELSCLTKGVKGTIRTFRIVPRIVPLMWRRTFTLPADPARAGFTMRNYPVFTLRVNGRVVGEGDTNYGNGLQRFDLTKNLSAGLNEVTVNAESAGGYGPSVNFYGELFVVAEDGTTTRFDSDGEWEYSFDGETWLKPEVRGRVGISRNEAGDYAASGMPLHAGAIDVKPDDPNGYPVFDYDRPVRWTAAWPKGVKDAVLTAVARQTVDLHGVLVEPSKAKAFAGKAKDAEMTFEGLPVGAYEIEWKLVSGDRTVDTLRNEMVVCGPIEQTEVAYADFEKTLQPRLKEIQSVDCTQAMDETRFLDHSGPYGKPQVNVGRVVDLGNGIRARETGPDELSYFSYKLDVGRLGALHILEVDVPDVREQTLYCWINESIRVGFCNNGGDLGSHSWANATGSVKCGGIMPLSGKVKTVRIVFCPCSRIITACFEKGKCGGPAAVCGFRVYEVEGDLPALKVPKTERRYGNHNERQIFAAWGAYVDPASIRYEMVGPSPRGWSAAFAAARNRTAYLRYCGHNASIEGGYMYTGWFPTRSGESTEPEADFDFRYPMFKMYRHNGIHAYVGYEYLRSPVLGRKGMLDTSDREVQAGTARTVYEVAKDGRQHIGYMGNGINFLNPDVRQSMTNILREVYERYAPIGDIEGLYVVNGGWWLPGIVIGGNNGVRDVSFDDDTIELFEKETGVRLGCGWSGKARFMKRYEKLNGEYAKVWYDWRAKKMRDALEEMREVVSRGKWKWDVYATGSYRLEKLNPFSRLGGTPEERSAYEAQMRAKAGFPVELYGEGSGSKVGIIPSGSFGREVYLEEYGTLFNPGSAAIRWKYDACFYACGSLNEHWVNCKAAKKWWWRNNGVDVYDVKQCGENAFFDCVETTAWYTPKLMFHTWLDVNVTSAQAEECRRFVDGFYATPLDRHPQDIPSVKGVLAKRYGDCVQLVNATPWGVKGKVKKAKVKGEGEEGKWEPLEIPPYGIVVRPVGNGTLEGEFAMAEGCPHADFAAARKAMDYETMRAASNRTRAERGRPNQERFLATLAKNGVVRVDAGSSVETVDEEGVRWLPDQPYAGSDTYGNELAAFVNRGPVAIGNTKAPAVYRTESGGASEFIFYHFPVPKGTYRLVCHVAETYDEAPGRLMDVTVNGEKRKVDVWQICGGRMRAGQFTFEDIKVPEGGMIRYESTSRPIVSAFEIFRTDIALAAGTVAGKSAKDYFALRDGMPSAKYAVKRNMAGWQWAACAANRDRWNWRDLKFGYPDEIRRLLCEKYKVEHAYYRNGYDPDLWWAQYSPGGRHTSCYAHFLDTDLMLAEYARDPQLAERHFEVILRQSIRRENSQSKVVVHGDDPEFVEAYRAGREHPAVAFAERLAAHYGIPSLNLAKACAELGPTGPQQTVAAFVDAAYDLSDAPGGPVAAKLPPPLAEGLNDNCTIVPYDDGAIRLKGGWQRGAKSVSGQWQHMLKTQEAGATMEMEFRGTEVGFLDFTVANGAAYEFRVDGGAWKRLSPDAAAKNPKERHTVFAEGLSFSGKVSAANDADRHKVEVRVVQPGEGLVVGLLVNGTTADDTEPEKPHTLAYLDGVYSAMRPVSFAPAKDAHRFIPEAMRRLREGGELRIVLLGDSLVADTSASDFELLLMRRYPKCKVTKICSVRSATGCPWYKDENRVDGWVLSHNPDLLMIGGISNHDDAEAVRSVVRQVRAKRPGLEIVLMSPIFGSENEVSNGSWNLGWDYDPDKAQHPFRRQLRAVAAEEKCAFFDICAEQRKYCLESGFDIGWFKRDGVHANDRGRQLVGRLLDCWFAQ